jgi:hypothetical protein
MKSKRSKVMKSKRSKVMKSKRSKDEIDSLVHQGRSGVTPVDLVRDPVISPYAKTLWTLLSTWSDVFPGTLLLQALVPCSRERLFKSFVELERTGWLSRKRRKSALGETTVYVLHYRCRAGKPVSSETSKTPDYHAERSVRVLSGCSPGEH